ncbi:MAG: DNA repair exonuclease [Bacteroidetes bacterium]|jgi:DNA repair exonuclease SbcCD nuclease subunit|nr:DNA repair exonuclease [Bacteroidota bacterium]
MASLRLLCTGDVHLGRRPTRVPADEALTVERVWQACVQAAIREAVDAVVLTGDLIDRENRYFEAIGPLLQGLQHLAAASIPVYAVAGNHDFDTLPGVQAFDREGVHLLGVPGEWTQQPLKKDGETVAILTGWSFPQQHVDRSPLRSFERPVTDHPVIGVLHADAGTAQSRYAPVSHQALQQSGVDLWLLGHLHRPQTLALPGTPVLYPGSPQPLDPGEQGVHGPWIIDVPAGGTPTLTQRPLATLRYAEVVVSLDGCATPDEIRRQTTLAVEDALAAHVAEQEPLRHLRCRLRFEGRTPLHRTVDDRLAALAPDLSVMNGSATATVERVTVATRPVHDLQALAQGNDPPAVLAQLLLAVEEGREVDGLAALEARLSHALRRLQRSARYQPLRQDADIDWTSEAGAPQDLLQRQGLLLLDALLAAQS